MHQALRFGRVAAAGFLLSFSSFVRTAAADPSNPPSKEAAAQCLEAYSDGQRARKNGQFQKARQLLAQCGGAECPTALHGDCQRWLSEVEAVTPRGVFRVLTPSGDEIEGAELSIDDAPAVALDGRALQFDPGDHWLEFRAPGFQPLRRKQSFVEGEDLVGHTVHLQRLPQKDSEGERTAVERPPTELVETSTVSPAAEMSQGRTTLPVWLGVGAAVVGAGGFSYFGVKARQDEKALTACSPNCANSRVEDVESEYLLANISLGVGVVGLLGAAAWLVFTPGDSRPNQATTNWELRVNSNSASVYGRF